jgi:hypothetical protein
LGLGLHLGFGFGFGSHFGLASHLDFGSHLGFSATAGFFLSQARVAWERTGTINTETTIDHKIDRHMMNLL